jgi:hypothetical protein
VPFLLIIFTSGQLLSKESQDSQLSGEKNRTKLACLIQILYQKSTFWQKKIMHCYAHFEKNENVFAYNSRTDRDI